MYYYIRSILPIRHKLKRIREKMMTIFSIELVIFYIRNLYMRFIVAFYVISLKSHINSLGEGEQGPSPPPPGIFLRGIFIQDGSTKIFLHVFE